MCIQPVTAWAFAGKHYDTELKATRAAIDEIGRRILKEYSSNPGEGMVNSPDLAKLLARHAELTARAKDPAPESPEGTREGEPEGTRDDGASEQTLGDAMASDR